MLWASIELLFDTYDVEILPKLLSDHNPLLRSFKAKQRLPHSWTFNMDLWRDSKFLHLAKTDLENYFLNDLNIGTDTHVVWDSCKATFHRFAWLKRINSMNRFFTEFLNK